jgi:hypothetical protein
VYQSALQHRAAEAGAAQGSAENVDQSVRCTHGNCQAIAKYGTVDDETRRVCARHKTVGDVDFGAGVDTQKPSVGRVTGVEVSCGIILQNALPAR